MDVPIAGCLFIDDAVARIGARLNVDDIGAGVLLLRAMQKNDITGQFRVVCLYREKKPRPLAARDWERARIDLDEFRRSNQGGIDGIAGRRWHLRRIVIHEDDFRRWLDGLLVPAEAAPTPIPVAAKRKHNGADYREADAPLVAEMHGLMEAREARSAEHAARMVMKRAPGYGTEAAKVKRLAKHCRQIHPIRP